MPDPSVTPEPKASSDDHEPDVYGPDSFPASDPPSTWWGGGHDTATARRADEEGSDG
jgi:hypothetical protein